MGRLNFGQMEALMREGGFSPEISPIMAAIGLAESGGNPYAHNPNASTGDNSYGLLQVNMLGRMGPERRREFGITSNEALFDPLTNVRAAKKIYDSQGLNAWSVFRSGKYKDHLPTGTSVMQVEKPLGQDLAVAMMGDASVGRGRSIGSKRKAGNKLLEIPALLCSGVERGLGSVTDALLQLIR